MNRKACVFTQVVANFRFSANEPLNSKQGLKSSKVVPLMLDVSGGFLSFLKYSYTQYYQEFWAFRIKSINHPAVLQKKKKITSCVKADPHLPETNIEPHKSIINITVREITMSMNEFMPFLRCLQDSLLYYLLIFKPTPLILYTSIPYICMCCMYLYICMHVCAYVCMYV